MVPVPVHVMTVYVRGRGEKVWLHQCFISYSTRRGVAIFTHFSLYPLEKTSLIPTAYKDDSEECLAILVPTACSVVPIPTEPTRVRQHCGLVRETGRPSMRYYCEIKKMINFARI